MASLPLAAKVVDDFIKKIEASITSHIPGQQIPGTVLQRVYVQNSMLRQRGVEVEGADKDSTFVWSLGIGYMNEAKHFIYGKTLPEVFALTKKAL